MEIFGSEEWQEPPKTKWTEEDCYKDESAQEKHVRFWSETLEKFGLTAAEGKAMANLISKLEPTIDHQRNYAYNKDNKSLCIEDYLVGIANQFYFGNQDASDQDHVDLYCRMIGPEAREFRRKIKKDREDSSYYNDMQD